MGWNIAYAFITQCNGYFSTFPRYDSERARFLIEKMCYGPVKQSSLSCLAKAVTSDPNMFSVGAYESGAFVSGISELFGFALKPDMSLVDAWLSEYQNASIIVFELSSVTNYFAYTIFDGRRLVRSVAGSAEKGLLVSTGPSIFEEQNGHKTDSTSISNTASGEETVFNVSARALGCRLDQYASENLTIENFKDARPVWPFRKTRTNRQ